MTDQDDNPYTPPQAPAEPPPNAFGPNVVAERLLLVAALALIGFVAMLAVIRSL